MTCSTGLFKWIQLALAAFGLAFYCASDSSASMNAMLIMSYVIIIIYLICTVICAYTGRPVLPIKAQVVFEIIAGIVLIILSVYIATLAGKDIWIILTIVVGFVLPAFLFVSAYEKM